MLMLTEKIVTKSSIKYLGLRLDSRLNFTAQIQNSAEKAAKVTTYLSRLMANIGGPTESKEGNQYYYGAEILPKSLKR